MNHPAPSPDASDAAPREFEAPAAPVRRCVVIPNPQGLHMRPVLKFVDLASEFDASVTVEKNDHRVDGKSPMEMMLLEGTCGSTLVLEAAGRQATEAIGALVALVEAGFDEMEPQADDP